MKSSAVSENIKAIALTVAFSTIGFLIAFLLRKLFHVELSKLEMSVMAFTVTTLSALLLFPLVFKVPFGKVSVKDFIQKVGLKIPGKPLGFIILGILAAILSLSGMLIGSMLTGKYAFDSSTITLDQAVFSLTPGIWEEVFYRGILMIVFLRITKSITRAAVFQVLIFALAHFKGVDLSALVDVFSVMIIAIAFTYLACKTKSLIPGIIFHYLHDTFLFAVQIPGGEYSGFHDSALFYGGLWLAMLVIIGITKVFSEKLGVVSSFDFYGESMQNRDEP